MQNHDLDNKNDSAWENRPDDVYIRVTIKDRAGNAVYMKEVKGRDSFTTGDAKNEIVELDVGYTVEIFSHANPARVRIWPSLRYGEIITEYNYIGPTVSSSSQFKSVTFKYEIVKEGFKIINYELTGDDGSTKTCNKDFVVADVIYKSIKDTIKSKLDEIVRHFEQYPENVNNKGIDEILKSSFAENYYKLREEDRTSYTELLDKILKGGVPTITLKNDTIVVNNKADLDFSRYLSIYDNEDRQIQLTSNNHTIEANGDLSKPGEYLVKLTVFDADGNGATCLLNVKILSESPVQGPAKSNTLTIVLIVVGVLIAVAGGALALFLILSKKKKMMKKLNYVKKFK